MCLIKNTRTNRRTQEHLFSRVHRQIQLQRTHTLSHSLASLPLRVLLWVHQLFIPFLIRSTSSPMKFIISPLIRQLNRCNCYHNAITSRNVSIAVIGSGPSGFYLTQALIKVSVHLIFFCIFNIRLFMSQIFISSPVHFNSVPISQLISMKSIQCHLV